MTFRHFLSWKPLFYDAFLPAIRRLGPGRSDAILDSIGRWSTTAWPPRRHALSRALVRARAALRTPLAPAPKGDAADLAANAVRFLARDYLLEGASDRELAARFDVTGFDRLQAVLDQGRGAILVGSHLGAHIAGLHWLYRQEIPLRLLVQRPRHISRTLNEQFDRDGRHPQSALFLRRDLTTSLAAERLLRARAALRDGLAVYLSGDIPWPGPNSRPGRLLGQPLSFLSIWADLAVVTHSPVFLIFCTHLPGGRYRLSVESPITVRAGGESQAVAHYLERLETEVTADPTDAIAYLTWPCYGPRLLSIPDPAARASSAQAIRSEPGHPAPPSPHSPLRRRPRNPARR